MTTVDIANLAIQLCGAEAVLVTLDDVNKEARLCRANYDQARRSVLQRHPWKFAIERVVLDVDTTEVPAFGYSARYLLPEDYLRVVTVNETYKEDWQREGRYLLTNIGGPINLRYITDEQSIEKFDPLFIDALVADIARRIVYPLTQSNERDKAIDEAWKLAIRLAKRASAIEQSPQTMETDTYTDARMVRLFDVPGR